MKWLRRMLASLAFILFRALWNRCASIIYEREPLSSLQAGCARGQDQVSSKVQSGQAGMRHTHYRFPGDRHGGTQLGGGGRSVKIFDDNIPARLDIYTIGELSAHADLLTWLSHFRAPPSLTFRSDFPRSRQPSTCAHLADTIRQKPNWNASIPVQFASVEI